MMVPISADEPEPVAILGEVGRPGTFLSVKLREDTAGSVLILPGGCHIQRLCFKSQITG